jgi:hypothetical protein
MDLFELRAHVDFESRFVRCGVSLALDLPLASQVTASLYDVRGRVVRVLVPSGAYAAGSHRIDWDGCGPGGERAASGVYFARVIAAGRQFSARVVVP